MNTEQLVAGLQAACPSGLRAVVLYGSAAAGDFIEQVSDRNVLVVLDHAGADRLAAVGPVVARWVRAGHPMPLLLTAADLRESADVFPAELLDLQEHGRVLFGTSPLADIAVRPAHLRLEVERELKAALWRLRRGAALARGRPRALRRLIDASLSTFLVLARANLRLFRREVPAFKLDALRALQEHVPVNAAVFERAQAWRAGGRRSKIDIAALFGAYLEAVETWVTAVDRQPPTEERSRNE